jgi:hypothetical protein
MWFYGGVDEEEPLFGTVRTYLAAHPALGLDPAQHSRPSPGACQPWQVCARLGHGLPVTARGPHRARQPGLCRRCPRLPSRSDECGTPGWVRPGNGRERCPGGCSGGKCLLLPISGVGQIERGAATRPLPLALPASWPMSSHARSCSGRCSPRQPCRRWA